MERFLILGVLANKNIEKTKIMNTDKLKELINNSDSNQVHKNIMIGFIDRVNETESKYREDRKLIEEVGGVKHLDEVILSNDDVKIYTVTPSEKDERETKYHYRSIVKNKDGKIIQRLNNQFIMQYWIFYISNINLPKGNYSVEILQTQTGNKIYNNLITI